MPAPAPIVLFAHRRPRHLRRLVESLLANPEAPATTLHIYCDAAGRPEHRAGVDAVRRYVEGIGGFASVERVFRERNLGLAQSVIDGVTACLRRHERIVVLEDDLVVSPFFLRYMNDGLACYADDAQVASIHGYTYPMAGELPETFFLRGADCWGWATWRRAWRHFDADGSALLAELRRRKLTRAFDLDGAYPYTRMLENQLAGRNDSWAVRWHASCFLQDMLTLYPGRSLVANLGTDDSGTHVSYTTDYEVRLAPGPVAVRRLPLTESVTATAALSTFFRRKRSPARRIRNVIRRMVRRLRLPGRMGA